MPDGCSAGMPDGCSAGRSVCSALRCDFSRSSKAFSAAFALFHVCWPLRRFVLLPDDVSIWHGEGYLASWQARSRSRHVCMHACARMHACMQRT